MKIEFRNILIIFLATIVFFVGAGVTIVDLCCSRCVHNILSSNDNGDDCSFEEGDDKLASCCFTQDDLNVVSTSCSNEGDDECCTAERVSIDLDSSTYQPKLFKSLLWVSTFCCCHLFAFECAHEHSFVEEISQVRILSPRTYLTLIRILII